MSGKAPEAFRTISEVAEELGVQKHVLRFWEGKFSVVKPMKRGGGRRYYRPEDIDLLRGICFLLYSEGYTVRGVQRILKEHGVHYVAHCWVNGAGGGLVSSVHSAVPRQEEGACDESGLHWKPDAKQEAAQQRCGEKRGANSRRLCQEEGGESVKEGGGAALLDVHLARLSRVLLDLRRVRSLLE